MNITECHPQHGSGYEKGDDPPFQADNLLEEKKNGRRQEKTHRRPMLVLTISQKVRQSTDSRIDLRKGRLTHQFRLSCRLDVPLSSVVRRPAFQSSVFISASTP